MEQSIEAALQYLSETYPVISKKFGELWKFRAEVYELTQTDNWDVAKARLRACIADTFLNVHEKQAISAGDPVAISGFISSIKVISEDENEDPLDILARKSLEDMEHNNPEAYTAIRRCLLVDILRESELPRTLDTLATCLQRNETNDVENARTITQRLQRWFTKQQRQARNVKNSI